MPIRVQVPGHGVVEFPDGTAENDMRAAIDQLSGTPQRPGAMARGIQVAGDVAAGVAKGAAHTALDLGQAVHLIPGVTPMVDKLYGTPGLSDEAFTQARAQTSYTNPAQMVGGGVETLAELAIPGAKAVEALPNAARAGRGFQEVMSAARHVPVDVNAPGQVALRIQELADRGASMPMVVRKFLGRITDPAKADLTYEEARDFASNISRLSADEYGRLTPVIAREVASLRASLNQAIGGAAAKAGKLAEYRSAMSEYASAMHLQQMITDALEGAKRALPYASAVGAGQWLSKKMQNYLGE